MGVYDEKLNVNYDERLDIHYHKKLQLGNTQCFIVAPKVTPEEVKKIWDTYGDYLSEIEFKETGRRVKYTHFYIKDKVSCPDLDF